MLWLLLAQNPFILRVRESARPGLIARVGAPKLPEHGNGAAAKVRKTGLSAKCAPEFL